jgi:DNA polymerase alpha subunit A
MKARNTAVRASYVIPYIFCSSKADGMGNIAQTERARHPDEFRKAGSEAQIGEWESLSLTSSVCLNALRLLQTMNITSRIRSYHQSSVFVTQSKGQTELASPNAWVCFPT